MIKKLNLKDCNEGLWKNGQGKTRQIAIYPHEATLEENNFLWRLSSATVMGANTFSEFPGYNRLLIVWKGEGLKLNGEKLLPDSPLLFAGEEKIECTLINDEVIDLGLIYDAKKIKARLAVLRGDNKIHAEKGTVFLFMAKGSGLLGKHTMNEGEILILENRDVQISLPENALAYEFLIEHL
jgi:environmental stress-induced protein Ves